MSLLDKALGYGRALARVRFTETVTVGKYTDGTDPTTGNPTRTLVGTASYEGPAQVKYPSVAVATSEGAQPTASQDVTLKLPSGTVVHEGEEVDVTASTVDTSLVGARYRVKGASQKGQTTSARYPVIELP